LRHGVASIDLYFSPIRLIMASKMSFDPQFVSIFGQAKSLPYCDAILQGQASDGGLYFFNESPKPSADFFKHLAYKRYEELFTAINSLFLSGIPLADQKAMAAAAYGQANFPFTDGNIAPVRHVDDKLYIQRLGGGPTGAFKDFALLPVAQHMNWALKESDSFLQALAATSGDTGPAAENAIKGLERIHLTMLSPASGFGMSDVQRAQMGALSGGNIVNIGIKAGFTTCQDTVVAIKKDPEFASLGAVNSINIARVLAQVPYKVSAYLQVIEQAGLKFGDLVDVVVPSGNFGNALASFVAREMGLPLGRIIVATNENNFLHDLIQNGHYRKRTSGEAVKTTSTSMDIDYANNVARLIYRVFGNEPTKTKAFMEQANNPDGVHFAEHGLPNDILKTEWRLDSGSSTATDRLESTRWVYETSHQQDIIDPHTADGVTVARRLALPDRPICVESTADPFKFGDAIEEALGVRPEMPERFAQVIEQAANNKKGYIIPPDTTDPIVFVKEVLRQR